MDQAYYDIEVEVEPDVWEVYQWAQERKKNGTTTFEMYHYQKLEQVTTLVRVLRDSQPDSNFRVVAVIRKVVTSI